MTQDVPIFGGGVTGLEIAAELAARGQNVTLIDDAATASRARTVGVTAHDVVGDRAESAVGQTAATVVVATSSDARNLMLGVKAPRLFGTDRVVALVNDPDRREAFEAANIETVCVSEALTRATTDAVDLEGPTPATPADAIDERRRLGG
jgi:Trk K+ transport system NAD-binding subunit